tara:strand:+ start:235 stop:897 length:663 start_codon:yes stop_codon:yes gene_type:complete
MGYVDLVSKNILVEKLKGNEELALLIISKKHDIINKETEEIKKEHIEYDFYNWLNCDLLIRKSLEINQGGMMYLAGELGFYQNNYKDLGLGLLENNSYRRTKSLTECFNSKWWKTHHKTHFNKWYSIHRIINYPKKIKVYNGSISDLVYLPNDVDDIDEEKVLIEFRNHNFRNPTIKEKNRIIIEQLEYEDFFLEDGINIEWFINNMLYVLVDNDLKIIS